MQRLIIFKKHLKIKASVDPRSIKPLSPFISIISRQIYIRSRQKDSEEDQLATHPRAINAAFLRSQGLASCECPFSCAAGNYQGEPINTQPDLPRLKAGSTNNHGGWAGESEQLPCELSGGRKQTDINIPRHRNEDNKKNNPHNQQAFLLE